MSPGRPDVKTVSATERATGGLFPHFIVPRAARHCFDCNYSLLLNTKPPLRDIIETFRRSFIESTKVARRPEVSDNGDATKAQRGVLT